jgi:hypothetical protein
MVGQKPVVAVLLQVMKKEKIIIWFAVWVLKKKNLDG